MRILILGVGNTLLGDEGFGVYALRKLEEDWKWPDNVKLVDGGTLGLMLMAELMECDLAIILDIARGGGRPGSFYRIDDLAGSLSDRHSMHQTSMEDVLVSCDLAGHRPQALAFAMEPFDMENISAELTAKAQERLLPFCEKVIAELAKMGIKAEVKTDSPV